MGVLTRVQRLLVRLGARRWPAEQRDDMIRDWSAELAVLEQEPGSGWQRLTFAASLACGPPARTEDGLPGWRAPGPVVRATVGLLLAGLVGTGVWLSVRMLVTRPVLNHLTDLTAAEHERWMRWTNVLATAVAVAVTTAYAAGVGRWLGRGTARHRPAAGPGRASGWAALAVLCLGSVLGWWLSTTATVGGAVGTGGDIGTVLMPWAATTFGAALLASRRGRPGPALRRGLWTLGVPTAAAVTAATVSVLLGHLGVVRPGPDAIAEIAGWLLPWTVCAVTFGRAVTPGRPASAAVPTPVDGPTTVGQPDGGPPPIPERDRPARDRPARTRPEPTRPGATRWVVNAVVAVAASGAAVLWAIGLVRLQPLSEPAPGSLGENNTYWARDLRWFAIAAIVLAVVVCARARPGVTWPAALVGLAWTAADIGLDHAQFAGDPGPLVAVAVAAAVAGCYLGARHDVGRDPGSRDPDSEPPGRKVLIVTAAVAVVQSAVALMTESPTDLEPALGPAAAAASSALAVIATGAALAAAHTRTRLRSATAGVVLAGAVAVPWWVRATYPQPGGARQALIVLFAGTLALGVAAVAWRLPHDRLGWLRYPAVAVGGTVGIPVGVVLAALAFLVFDVGDVVTRLAGSPPIDSADTDLISVLPATLAGLALGVLLTRVEPPPDTPGSGLPGLLPVQSERR